MGIVRVHKTKLYFTTSRYLFKLEDTVGMMGMINMLVDRQRVELSSSIFLLWIMPPLRSFYTESCETSVSGRLSFVLPSVSRRKTEIQTTVLHNDCLIFPYRLTPSA